MITCDPVAVILASQNCLTNPIRDVPSLLLIDDSKLRYRCGRVIYSYVMYSRPQTARKLQSVLEILKKPQTGSGSNVSVTSVVVLATIVAIMSLA